MSSPTTQGAPRPDVHGQLLQLATGFMPAASLYAATKLEIADALADGPKPVSELARTCRVNEGALYRSLRALSSIGIFREMAPGTFGNTPLSEGLRSGTPDSARDTVLFLANPLHFRVFGEFMYAVETGETAFEKATGMKAFEFFQRENAESAAFNAGMTSISGHFIPPVIEAYDFGESGTLADIGGGHGVLLSAILRKHRGLRGILFDVPHVVAGARDRIASEGLASRCEVVGGDFFEKAPAADSYVLKSIIHDWDDERSVAILKNCAAAMRSPDGKVILIELHLKSGNEPDLAKWIDLEMLAMAGGRERTGAEYAALFARAGLRLARVVHSASPFCAFEGVRA